MPRQTPLKRLREKDLSPEQKHQLHKNAQCDDEPIDHRKTNGPDMPAT